MKERKEIILTKIEMIKRGISEMNQGGDISALAMKLLISDLNNLELQIENIEQEYTELEK